MNSLSNSPFRRPVRRLTAALAAVACFWAASPAHATPVPNTVSPPKGINLGSTSFFDGFGRTTEGLTWLQYGRFEDLTHITDYQGNDSKLFKSPSIQVYVTQIQLSYASDWHPFGGDAVGISALLPIADFHTHFAQNSPVKLTNNGFGAGDLNFGPFYQSRYIMEDSRPVFAWRFQLCVIAPTGNVDEQHNINQGSGFWAVNPLVAMTWVPLPQIELTTRLNYQYNAQTTTLQAPPPIPHYVYNNGQAGQIVYGNLDMSWALIPAAYIGINAYALAQLTPNLTNGHVVSHSRETEFSIGPGGRYVFDVASVVNVNLYLSVVSRNATSGTQLNVQYIHKF